MSDFVTLERAIWPERVYHSLVCSISLFASGQKIPVIGKVPHPGQIPKRVGNRRREGRGTKFSPALGRWQNLALVLVFTSKSSSASPNNFSPVKEGGGKAPFVVSISLPMPQPEEALGSHRRGHGFGCKTG